MSETNLDRRDMTLRQKLSIPEASDTPWSMIDATLITLALLVTVIIVGPAIASLPYEDITQIPPSTLLLGWTIGQVLTIAFVVINRRSSQESWQALKLDKGLVPQQLVVLIGVAIALTIDVIISLLSGQFLPIPEIYGFQTAGIGGIILAAVFVVLIQPIAESLVFQGVLLPKLRVIMGPWGGVVMTAVVFTLMHYAVFFTSYQAFYPSEAMLWYGVAYPLLAGLAFSLFKVYTQSTRAVILGRVGAGLIFLMTAMLLVG